jgi:hypothetical protein
MPKIELTDNEIGSLKIAMQMYIGYIQNAKPIIDKDFRKNMVDFNKQILKKLEKL